mgnify:CR=1 FL=1
MTRERLYLYDTTLRDGQQTQGVQFSVAEKVQIAAALEAAKAVRFAIDAGLAHALAFPAARINEPAGGQLDGAIGQVVVHNFWVAGDDVGALLG